MAEFFIETATVRRRDDDPSSIEIIGQIEGREIILILPRTEAWPLLGSLHREMFDHPTTSADDHRSVGRRVPDSFVRIVSVGGAIVTEPKKR